MALPSTSALAALRLQRVRGAPLVLALWLCRVASALSQDATPHGAAAAAPDAGVASEPQALELPKLLHEVELTLPPGVNAPDGVTAQLEIDAGGRVTAVQLEQSLGDEADRMLQNTLQALRFSPAQRAGRAIAARVRMRFEVSTELI